MVTDRLELPFAHCSLSSACCSLTLADFRLWVHLGCGEEEKHHPQLVSFGLTFFFRSPPEGITSDRLSDTVCYLEAAEAVRRLCCQKRFNLVEHLGYTVFRTVCQTLGARATSLEKIRVTVHKVAPPVPDLHGGVTFEYTAAPPDAFPETNP